MRYHNKLTHTSMIGSLTLIDGMINGIVPLSLREDDVSRLEAQPNRLVRPEAS